MYTRGVKPDIDHFMSMYEMKLDPINPRQERLHEWSVERLNRFNSRQLSARTETDIPEQCVS